MKSLKDKIQEATEKAAQWLHLGNLASERGEKEKAERHYARSQKWHDRMIDLSGDGDCGGHAREEKEKHELIRQLDARAVKRIIGAIFYEEID